MIAGIKLVGLITAFLSLAASAKAAVISGAVAKFALNPIAGVAILAGAGLVGYGIARMLSSATKAEPPKIKRYQNLNDTQMVTLDKGSAVFDAGETVTRTDNFTRLTEGINTLIGVTIDNKPSKPFAKWEVTTSYR